MAGDRPRQPGTGTTIGSVVMVLEIGTKTAVFNSIGPYQNHGFRLSIDGFGFLVSETVQL